MWEKVSHVITLRNSHPGKCFTLPTTAVHGFIDICDGSAKDEKWTRYLLEKITTGYKQWVVCRDAPANLEAGTHAHG